MQNRIKPISFALMHILLGKMMHIFLSFGGMEFIFIYNFSCKARARTVENTNKLDIVDVTHNHPQIIPRKGSMARKARFKAQKYKTKEKKRVGKIREAKKYLKKYDE